MLYDIPMPEPLLQSDELNSQGKPMFKVESSMTVVNLDNEFVEDDRKG